MVKNRADVSIEGRVWLKNRADVSIEGRVWLKIELMFQSKEGYG